MTFPYRRYELEPAPGHADRLYIHRPVIPIHVTGSVGTASVLGLLDTGADATLLPAFLVNQLGVELDPTLQASFRGVGGHLVTVRYGTIHLEVRQGRRSHRWSASVGFLEGGSVAILGHAGFLERFTTTFSPSRLRVTLRERV